MQRYPAMYRLVLSCCPVLPLAVTVALPLLAILLPTNLAQAAPDVSEAIEIEWESASLDASPQPAPVIDRDQFLGTQSTQQQDGTHQQHDRNAISCVAAVQGCQCPGCQAFARQVSSGQQPQVVLAAGQQSAVQESQETTTGAAERPVFRELRSLGTDIQQKGDPADAPNDYASLVRGSYDASPILGAGPKRDWADSYATWTAPSFYHRPLYFEEPDLERYGHYVCGWRYQSMLSTAHFFGGIATLPYQVGSGIRCDRVHTLGYLRPGNCNPQVADPLPWSPSGLVWHHLTMTGLVFLAL